MIIDLILDRQHDDAMGRKNAYSPAQFYRDCMEYSAVFDGIGDGITRAMDFGTEDDVRKALCEYITLNGYDVRLYDYIKSRKWIS